MLPQLDVKLINDFRSKVHDHNDFIRVYFVDYHGNNDNEGIDIWSKICSCMDWLTVAIEGIELPEESSNMNVNSLKFTHFLVTIDMIVEAVTHLWKSIGSVNNIDQPFINSNDIFSAKEFGRNYSDEKYFKEIRSWFGVHSVNGNQRTIETYKKPVRFFSSWSSSRLFRDNEYVVNLYSNNSRAEEEFGGIKAVNIDKIIEFAVIRYNSLPLLMNEIDNIYSKEVNKLRAVPVKLDESKSDLEQLKQLRAQAIDRKLISEHYEYDIDEYISFLSCDTSLYEGKDKIIVDDYLKDLKAIISDYHQIVQNVDWDEYKTFEMLSMRSEMFRDNHYDYSKVLDFTHGGNYWSGLVSLDSLIEKGYLPEYSKGLPYDNLRLLIHALDHKFYDLSV